MDRGVTLSTRFILSSKLAHFLLNNMTFSLFFENGIATKRMQKYVEFMCESSARPLAPCPTSLMLLTARANGRLYWWVISLALSEQNSQTSLQTHLVEPNTVRKMLRLSLLYYYYYCCYYYYLGKKWGEATKNQQIDLKEIPFLRTWSNNSFQATCDCSLDNWATRSCVDDCLGDSKSVCSVINAWLCAQIGASAFHCFIRKNYIQEIEGDKRRW